MGGIRKPNFMCIGAAKSGTTTLYDILRQHNDIFIPSFKEPHFFDIPSVYENGLKWYLKTYFSNVKNEKCIGDFTPTYLFEKEAPKRIFNYLGPDMKFIVILRNPVDRAYSHYLHSKRDEHEHLNFEEAILTKPDERDYLTFLRRSYIEQGQYFDMLSRYLEFFSKENFLMLNFEEDIVNTKDDTLERILLFLDLEYQNLDTNIDSNKASVAKFIWLKQFMKKTGWWRRVLKSIIPSLKIRQIIKNRIQRANIRTFKPVELEVAFRKELYNKFYAKNVKNLEELIERKMNWN